MGKNIIIKNLTKDYSRIRALDNVCLELSSGKIIGLLGSNGSGKTTLIKILAGLIADYKGEVTIYNETLSYKSKSLVSYLPDVSFIEDSWSFNYAINYFSDFFEDFSRTKALNMVTKLGIDPNRKFSTLSKGTKEKFQLALILARNAKVYLFDEPIASVDPAAREVIFEMITENINPEATAIITTHLVSDVERILDDVVLIKKGKILLNGDVKNLVAHYNKSLDEIFRELYRC